MRLVSSRSQAEIERERAAAALSWALRDLAANLLRVIRGAGKAYCIPEQTVEVLQALKGYHDIAGTPLSDYEMAEMLRFGSRTPSDGMSEEQLDRMHAEEMIVRGALQVAASRLIQQSTQRSAGQDQIYDGVRELERVREEGRMKLRMPLVEAAKRGRQQVSSPRATRPRKKKL